MHNQLNTRVVALALGVLIYTALQSGAALQALEDLLKALLPDLTRSSALSIKVIGALIQAGSLISIIALIERTVLLWKTRRIRGEWIYKSSSGNWGHVRIYLQRTNLRYSVDLYLRKADLIQVLVPKIPMPSIGHGFDRMSVYTGDHFYAWYYVPPTRFGDIEYAERQGMLTLMPTLDPNSYSARWERTGPLATSATAAVEGPSADVARRDQRSEAGSFYFFLRKKTFLQHEATLGE